jgi:transglutaminase-like putative cysteine protease
MNRYLRPTRYLDSDHPSVASYAQAAASGGRSDRERAVRLYYAVRDDIRYEPYGIDLSPEGMTASACLDRRGGFCVAKAVLLAAAGRAVGIPTRLGFVDVRNHLATERLRSAMGTDLFAYHGFMEFYLDGSWLKATPAFNLSLCEKFGVLPLEFDGKTDSLFHPYDREGRRHMEYVQERGAFDDLPLDLLTSEYSEMYPGLFERTVDGDFAAEAEAERRIT